MATLIRLKRRTSAGNSGVILQAGEAYYNTVDKKLYIGNTDGDDVSEKTKKHIAQITNLSTQEDQIVFTVGEHPDNNKFTKTINNVADAKNLTDTINGQALSEIFRDNDDEKPYYAKHADDITNLKLNLDSSTNIISLSWGDEDQYGGGEDERVCLDGLTINGTMDSANQLKTSRELITVLDSTTVANFNGTKNVDIGVTGTLPLGHGGTGATTAPQALQNLGLTATAKELNTLDGITATVTQLNYVKGVKRSIQDQLDEHKELLELLEWQTLY